MAGSRPGPSCSGASTKPADAVTVHFIGAGPGAADLLTVRAVSLIASSPVCVYAGTYIGADVLAHCPADATLIDSQAPRSRPDHRAPRCRASSGLDVARLCSGDPSIFSALAEQARRLDRAGVPWDVTPGVPAYAAAAALIGRELTVPEVTQTVILTRTQADSTAMPEAESLARLAESRATLVLHLAIRHVRRLAAELTPAYGPDCPVVVVSRATPAGRADPARNLDRHRRPGRGRRAAAGRGDHGRRGRSRAEGFVESHLYGSADPVGQQHDPGAKVSAVGQLEVGAPRCASSNSRAPMAAARSDRRRAGTRRPGSALIRACTSRMLPVVTMSPPGCSLSCVISSTSGPLQYGAVLPLGVGRWCSRRRTCRTEFR